MNALGESKASAVFALPFSIFSLASAIVLFTVGQNVGRYIGGGACLVLFLILACRIMAVALPGAAYVFRALMQALMNVFLCLVLAIMGFSYGEPFDFFYAVSLVIMAYGVIICFFKENDWKGGKTPQYFLVVRNIGLVAMAFFTVLSCCLLCYDKGFQGAYCLLFIPVAAAALSYFLPPYFKFRFPSLSIGTAMVFPVILGLCPIAFLFL